MLTNGKLTVYNSYYEVTDGINLYFKTVIESAWFNGKVRTSVADNGIVSAEEYNARVLLSASAGGKKYINAKDYQKLPVDMVPYYFTFAPGDKFVQGDIDFEIQPGVHGYSIADLEKRYSHVATVTGHNIREFGDEKFHSLVGT